jgi:hypothetical protein
VHITDMKPHDFVEALAQLEVEAARQKVRGDNDYIAIHNDVALELVRLATFVIRTEIETKKFNDGFGYKKADDPWALAMEAAEAVL